MTLYTEELLNSVLVLAAFTGVYDTSWS